MLNKKLSHPVAQRLQKIVNSKQSNLALSADVIKVEELISLLDKVGPYLCIAKTHIDILEDFSPVVIAKLKDLAKKHDFLLFEDKKFADIGNTTYLQYKAGIYNIASWSDIVTIHAVAGMGTISALKKAATEIAEPRAGLMVLDMSSQDHLMTDSYQQKVLAWAQQNSDFVIGCISQTNAELPGELLKLTPGINLSSTGDNLGQQYRTPQQAINEAKSDILIVGRGICSADDPVKSAQEYRQQAWQAFIN